MKDATNLPGPRVLPSSFLLPPSSYASVLVSNVVSPPQYRKMTTALVLFAHGIRGPEWAAPLHRIRGPIAARRVELACLEIMQPPFGEIDTVLDAAADWLARKAQG
jgi:hypothetical protein